LQQFFVAMLDGCLLIPLTLLTLCLPWRTVSVVQGLQYEHGRGQVGEVNGELRLEVVRVSVASACTPCSFQC
jgi:hypothetical protein